VEGHLIKALFGKLLEALRFNNTGRQRESAEPETIRRKEAFTVHSDGIEIRGQMFFPVARPSRLYPVLVICHGIPGSGTARDPGDPGYVALANDFASLGIATVIFNFRGCGDSGGNFEMMGWARDLEAVMDRVLNTPFIDPTRAVVLGFSGGGAAAIRVAADRSDIYGLAVVGTPSNFTIFEKDPVEIVDDFRDRGIIRDIDFPQDLERWMAEFQQIEPRRWVSHFKGRFLLIVHGDADEVVPFEQGRELFEKAPAGITEFEIIHGGLHRLRLDPLCLEILKQWVMKSLKWKV
jgi:pimeloyl-ACP methyl ester carboxylesterase